MNTIKEAMRRIARYNDQLGLVAAPGALANEINVFHVEVVKRLGIEVSAEVFQILGESNGFWVNNLVWYGTMQYEMRHKDPAKSQVIGVPSLLDEIAEMRIDFDLMPKTLVIGSESDSVFALDTENNTYFRFFLSGSDREPVKRYRGIDECFLDALQPTGVEIVDLAYDDFTFFYLDRAGNPVRGTRKREGESPSLV